ncbi:hypothetical protein CLAFUW4_02814 [Fulvia fulva]|uniref:Uncharacterized protein n=1 Tax=Passalora fulva TaxID=5499 RepID=A0A9Q8LB90_PASFU|nr:uncharacterized protein CLAFUR5_02801 [Fulvia fulva]UJO14217.1 hypothetical protein CLAFUR5_02801 [Fulvia fulva]WPV11768.1 hypothetical protein CLAFUW4_02814 [Fulvia fulva]
MDKLKKALSPGSSKDDEVLYGDAETRTREGAATTDAPAGHAVPHTVSPDAQLQTDKGQKDHSILRQILNPHGEKYDAEGYGSTAHVVGQGSDITGSNTGAGIGSSAAQSLPDRTAQTTAGPDSHLGRDAHVGPTTTTTTPTTTSSQPITERPHPLGGQSVGGDHINPISRPEDRAVQHGTDSHLGRDAGIAGGLGAAGVGAGAYSQHDRAGDHVTPTTEQANTAVVDRPHPLGGHDAPGDHINPISAPEDPAAASSTVGSHSQLGRDAGIAGVGAAGLGAGYAAHEHNQNQSTPLTGTTGAGTTGIGGSTVPSQLNAAPRDVQDATYTARQYNIPGDNCSGAPAEGYVHHTHGPHSTDIANRLDPHVPGEFPTESGVDRHGAGGSASAAPLTSIPDRDPSLTQAQPGQTGDHHYGRDAALGAGAGAAGYGAYEAAQGRGDTGPASKTIGPHDSNIANIVDPRVQPEPEKMKDSKTTGPHSSDLANKADPRVKETSTVGGGAIGTQSDHKPTVGEKLYPDSTPTDRPSTEHTGTGQDLKGTEDQHHGRDAALVGGAGALGGAGAYAATRDHDKPITEQLASTHGTQTQPAYHATTDSSAATQPGTNLPDSRHRNKEAAHAGEAGLAGTGAGAGAGAFASGDQSAAKKTGPAAGPSDTPVQHTGDPKSIAATHRDDKGHSSHTKEEEKEKKPSLIHRILHPGEGKEKEKESHHDEKKHDNSSGSHSHSHDEHNKLHKKALGEGKTTEEAAQHAGGNDGRVIEPHTGLPMNTAKYGTGQGGTDGAQNIAGYHETDPAIRNATTGTGVGAGTSAGHAQPGQEGVAGPDWDAIKKANTPY